MKVLIKNGVIILPQDIINKMGLPKNGECEIIPKQNEIKILIKKSLPIPYDIINDIKQSKIARSVKEMVKDELVQDL